MQGGFTFFSGSHQGISETFVCSGMAGFERSCLVKIAQGSFGVTGVQAKLAAVVDRLEF